MRHAPRSFTADCADFGCDPGFRRKANSTQCVQDECTKVGCAELGAPNPVALHSCRGCF